jgi:hypothetical protein
MEFELCPIIPVTIVNGCGLYNQSSVFSRSRDFIFAIASRPVLGSTQPGSEFDHSLPSRFKVKSVWSYTSALPYYFMV